MQIKSKQKLNRIVEKYFTYPLTNFTVVINLKVRGRKGVFTLTFSEEYFLLVVLGRKRELGHLIFHLIAKEF